MKFQKSMEEPQSALYTLTSVICVPQRSSESEDGTSNLCPLTFLHSDLLTFSLPFRLCLA